MENKSKEFLDDLSKLCDKYSVYLYTDLMADFIGIFNTSDNSFMDEFNFDTDTKTYYFAEYDEDIDNM